jgi:hypothetical protein
MRRRWLLIAASLCVVAVMPGRALANPITIRNAAINIQVNSDSSINGTSPRTGDGTATADGYVIAGNATVSEPGGTAGGAVTLSAEGPSLHGSLDFTIDSTSNGLWQVFGQSEIDAMDVFTFGGPSGPLEFAYTFELTGSEKLVNTPAGQCTVYPPINVGEQAYATASFVLGPISQSFTASACDEASANRSISGTFTTVAGDGFEFYEALALTSDLFSSTPGSYESIVDVSHTAQLFLAPVTPGAFYTTASGNDYSRNVVDPTPVPEPASLTLLGAGLAAIGVRRRQQSFRG